MASLHLLLHHLSKRADNGDVGNQAADPEPPLNPSNPQYWVDFLSKFSSGGLFIIIVTILGFSCLWIAIHYTLHMVLTLSYVESEEASVVFGGVSLNPPAYTDVTAEYSDTPSTSANTISLRRTLHHLYSISGPRSFFRGAACAISYSLVFNVIAGVLIGILNAITRSRANWLMQFIGSMIACFALIHWQTAWNHIVISEPSALGWLRRVPNYRRTLSNVSLATAVHELASRCAGVIPMALAFAIGLSGSVENGNIGDVVGKLIAVTFVAMGLYITLVIPASVSLARVQASMLPEEDETIVPFDRSFAGKVDPAVVGGSGALGFLDAWKSLDLRAKRRIIKLCAKVVAVQIVVYVVMAFVLAIEVTIFYQETKAAEGEPLKA